MSRVLILVGFLVVMGSLLFFGAAVTELLSGANLAGTSPTEPGILVGLSAFFALSAAGGGYLMLKNIAKLREKQARKEKQEKAVREKIILKVIAEENGKVTPLDVATRTELPVDEAKQLLDELSTRLGGDIQVTGDGGIVYVFDVSSRDEKKDSKRLTDL